MHKIKYKIAAILMCLLLINFSTSVNAQNDKGTSISLEFSLVNEQGEPVKNALVYSAYQRLPIEMNDNNSIKIKTSSKDVLVIKAFGYEDVTLNVTDVKGKVVLPVKALFSGSESVIYTPYSQTTERNTVGAYSKVSGEELENNATTSLYNSIGGRINGLFQQQNFAKPGSPSHRTYVRGNWGDYITIVDGVQREIDNLDPEVIESVQLLKDASLKAMYGGVQANGILVVKTKRGKANINNTTVRSEVGVQMPTHLPKYLDSYDYAVNYNKAMSNAGADPLYDEYALEQYKSGTSPYLYPSVDFYDELLNSSSSVRKISAQSTGGSEKVRYFSHIGYEHEGGLEKQAKYPNKSNAFNLRAAVDMEVNEFISFSASLNSSLQQLNSSSVNSGTFFNRITSYYPNDFPLTIPRSLAGLTEASEGENDFVYGGTSDKRDNPMGILSNRGYRKINISQVQSDFGALINLDKWVKGLKVQPFVSLDVAFRHDELLGGQFAVYEPTILQTPDGADSLGFNSWGLDELNNSASRENATVRRNFVFYTSVNYDRTFGDHAVSAMLHYAQTKLELGETHEYPRRQNLALKANYTFKNKYVVEAIANRTGVTSFSPDNRHEIFPTIGAAWIISDEDFMSVSAIDYLKLRSSYGVIGSTTYTSEGAYSTHLHDDIYGIGARVGIDGSNENYVAGLNRVGNPNVGFQKSKEFNAGIDALLFNQSLWLSAGYFNNLNDGLIADGGDEVPGISGHGAALPWRNCQAVRLSGFEGEINYTKQIEDFKISVGGHFTYGITDRVEDPEPDYPNNGDFDGLIILNKPTDIIRGYKVIGTFQDEADIANSPIQTFGAVFPGDLKYEDRNNDGVVDELDRTVVGNNDPRLMYGLNIDLYYKNFNLNIFGVGYGEYTRQLDNKYYRIFGTRKYSDVVVDGLPNGNEHPQLSIRDLNNNFVSSDYWAIDGSYFKLRSVELGYTIPSKITRKIKISKCKIFTRGFNLLTLSKIKKLNPESLNAGVNDYPLMSVFTGGLAISF